jgi:arylesterase / paraoxonase
VLYLFYANAPNRLQQINTLPGYEIRWTDTVRNCEDAYMSTDPGFALLSCDPGRDKWNTVMVCV